MDIADRFQSRRPSYQPPKNATAIAAITPKFKNNTPAKPLAQSAEPLVVASSLVGEKEVQVVSSEVKNAYTITLYSDCGIGAEIVSVDYADLYGAAQTIADRKLFNENSDVYAVIANNVGKQIETRVNRCEAIARTLRRPSQAAAKNTARTSAPLSWGARAKQDRCSFSRG